MPVLENERHELFAQGIAKGQSQREAYLAAGFTAKTEGSADVSACKLLSTPKVSERVKELLERAANKATYDLAWFLEQGAELFKAAKEAGDHAAASAQYQRLATVAGVWVEKAETNTKTLVRDIRDQPLSAQEWAEQHTTH